MTADSAASYVDLGTVTRAGCQYQKQCMRNLNMNYSGCSREMLELFVFVGTSSEYVISLKAFNRVGEGLPIYETVFTREETSELCSLSCRLAVSSVAVVVGLGKGSYVTSAGWQVTLCDPMWHVSSRSGVATLRTAIHLLFTYLSYLLVCVADQRLSRRRR